MKKRLLAFLILTVMLVTLFAACGTKTITAEKAQEIALEAAGLDAKDVDDVHTHVTTYEKEPCYNIHITVDGAEYNYNIAASGEILSADDIP